VGLYRFGGCGTGRQLLHIFQAEKFSGLFSLGKNLFGQKLFWMFASLRNFARRHKGKLMIVGIGAAVAVAAYLLPTPTPAPRPKHRKRPALFLALHEVTKLTPILSIKNIKKKKLQKKASNRLVVPLVCGVGVCEDLDGVWKRGLERVRALPTGSEAAKKAEFMGIARVVFTAHFTALFCSVAVNTLVRVLVGLVMDRMVSKEDADDQAAGDPFRPDALTGLAVEAEVAAVLSQGLGREVLAAVDGFLARGVPVVQEAVTSAVLRYLLDHPLDHPVDEAELGSLTGDVRLAVEAAWAGIQVPTAGEAPHPLAAMIVAAIAGPAAESAGVKEVLDEAKDLLESHPGGVAIQASLDLVFAVAHAKLKAAIRTAPDAKLPLAKLLKPMTEVAKDASNREGSEALRALFDLEAVKNFASTTLCCDR
jgi:hypothetical protein